LTGLTSDDKPDIEFFRPHISALNIGGKFVAPSEGKKVFTSGHGPSFETIQKQRTAILENIKDDITLKIPGRTDAAQKEKIELLRYIFSTSSWSEIENNDRLFTVEKLKECRTKIEEWSKL
jgi:hypothetical protein